MSWIDAGFVAGGDLVAILLFWTVITRPHPHRSVRQMARFSRLWFILPITVMGWTALIHGSLYPWALAMALPLSVAIPELLWFLSQNFGTGTLN